MTRLCPSIAKLEQQEIERKDEEDFQNENSYNPNDHEQKYQENDDNQQNQSQSQSQSVQKQGANMQEIIAGIMQILGIIWGLFTAFLGMIKQKKQGMTTNGNTQRQTATAYTRFGSKINYFAEAQDNVKIIRYIIGEMEELFNITGQQQKDLMNKSIMYEPSQSLSPSIANRKRTSFQQQQSERQSPQRNMNRGRMIWNRPCGEWEW
eukprot:CAMPEP_0201575296 /NCGR_PEP_ID=MMETSP0190_2-20130828/20404_1 /ASSEMBLY_ACC=CAM_ASM_000263 /TAXON_ID=37353 /ORGANISM="Rosalina sp." /LENGTH=206 /DNA_ID=CAMNT_0048004733 /DNA_START=264 /DNA_END=881 /DNA_ORIENTATION=+